MLVLSWTLQVRVQRKGIDSLVLMAFTPILGWWLVTAYKYNTYKVCRRDLTRATSSITVNQNGAAGVFAVVSNGVEVLLELVDAVFVPVHFVIEVNLVDFEPGNFFITLVAEPLEVGNFFLLSVVVGLKLIVSPLVLPRLSFTLKFFVMEHVNACCILDFVIIEPVIKMLQLVRGLLKAFELVFLLLQGNQSTVELDAQVVVVLLLGNPSTLELRVVLLLELRDAFRVALLELRDAFRVALLELILLTIHLILLRIPS